MNRNQMTELLHNSKGFVGEQVTLWKETYKDNLRELERLLLKLPDDLISSTPSIQPFEKLVSLFNEFLEKGFTFLEPRSTEDILRYWDGVYNDLINRIPETVEHALPYDFYTIENTDRPIIRIWKHNQRILWKLRKYSIKLRNRDLSEEEQIEKANNHRSFNQHHILKNYLDLPVRSFFLDEYPEFQRNYAYILHLSHDIMNFSARIYWQQIKAEENNNLDELLEKLKKTRVELEERITGFRNAEIEIYKRFEEIVPGIEQILDVAFMNAGTFLLPARLYTGKLLHGKEKKNSDLKDRMVRDWTSIFTGEFGEWHKDLDMSRGAYNLAHTDSVLNESVSGRFEENTLRKYARIKTAIEHFSSEVKRFSEAENINPQELSEKTINFRKQLREEYITDALQQLIHHDLNAAVQKFTEEMTRNVENLPDEYSILLQFDLSQPDPSSLTASLPLKRMISEEVLRDLKKDTDALKERILKKQNKTIRMISELDNILMFNSEIAIDLLEKKESPEENEKALDMIIEAMHRAITQLKETEKNDRELIREILTGIRKLMIVNGNSLTSFLDPTTVTRIRNRIAKALVRERYRKVLNTFLSLTTGVVKLIWKNVSKLLLLLIGRYKRIKELTGIEATPEDVTEHIAHLLKESEALFSKLPYIFQKLYENKPVVDNRLFVMRKKEIGELSKQYQNFKNGHPSKVMIFGETGSGKTSLLYFTQNMLLRNEKVINITFEHTIPDKNKLIGILAAGFNLPDCRTLDDLKRQLNLLPGPVYLICENLHNLYLKKMGGFEILQEFLLLMNHTQKKVFWIVSCNKYSWEYLQIVAGVKLHFTKVIDLGNLNAEEIENVIVKRQRISGYQVIYTPAPEDLVSKTYKKCKTPQAKQNYLHDRFYKRLAFASGGNLMVAMQLSLKAIEKVEKDYLIVNVAVKVDSNFLTTLSEESLFYLTALLQHGELCVEEYSIIFNTTIEQASLVVNSLTDKGILNENEGNYKIHPYLLRPIVQVLLNKNLLV